MTRGACQASGREGKGDRETSTPPHNLPHPPGSPQLTPGALRVTGVHREPRCDPGSLSGKREGGQGREGSPRKRAEQQEGRTQGTRPVGGKGGRGEKVYPPPPELAARERAGMGAPRHPSTPIGGSGMWFPTVRTPRVPLLPDCSSRLRCTQPGDPSTIDGEATRGGCDESHGGIGKPPHPW